VLMIGIGLGFWIARATQERPATPAPRTATAPDLPPSAALVPSPSLSGGRPSAPVRLPPPAVAPRPSADPWGRPATSPPYPAVAPRTPPWPATVRPSPGSAARPRVPRPSTTPRRQGTRVAAATPVPLAGPPAPTGPSARPGEALVLALNAGRSPLKVTLEGAESHTALVAPGARFPIFVPAGTYRVTLDGSGQREVRRSVNFQAGERYPIRFPE
jgi:hypothetical protein